MKKLMTIAALAVATIATPALAQTTDGVLSITSSTGTFAVTAVIPPMVRISGLDALTINPTPAQLTSTSSTFTDGETKFCVYSNINASGDYKISVSGTPGTGGAPYSLSGGTGGTLNHYVFVSDVVTNATGNGPGGVSRYTYNGDTKSYKTTAGGQARPTSISCAGTGENAVVNVRLNNSDVLAAQAGTYTGTLTVTVSVI